MRRSGSGAPPRRGPSRGRAAGAGRCRRSSTAGSARPRAKLAAARAREPRPPRQGRAGRRAGRGDRAEHHRPGLAADGRPATASQQCYNAQQVTSEDLLVIATELTDDPTDMAWFEPMMAQPQHAAALIEAHRPAPAPAHAAAAGTRRAAAPAGSGWRWPMPGTCPGTT